MKRTLFALALAAGLVAGSAPAIAESPGTISGGLEWRCPQGFRVSIEFEGKAKEIQLSGGETMVIFPQTTATVTNLGNDDNTAEFVITGKSRIETLPDGSTEWVLTGPNLVLVPRTSGPSGHPSGVYYTTGSVNFALDPKGKEERLFSGSGSVTDVCAALA